MLTGKQTPSFKHTSKDAKDYRDGEKAVRFMDAYGQAVKLDQWQRDTILDWMARGSDGKFVHKVCGISVPRQQGKGVLIEAYVLYCAIVLGEDLIVTSHHLQTTKSTFNRITGYFENPNAPELADKVKVIRRANGQLEIELKNGATISFLARTKSSGRGKTATKLILDEAQELSLDAQSALMPIISSRPDSQVIMLGTPDTGTSESEVFTQVRETGLKEKSTTLAYSEWSASPDDDPEDPKTWAKANPALNIRLSEINVSTEFDAMTTRAFMIERLGIWFTSAGTSVIDPDLWNSLVDGKSQPQESLVVAIDVSPSRNSGSISVAGLRSDGLVHVEVIDHRADGIAWIVPRLREIVDRHNIKTVVIDSKGPASSLEDQISKIRGLRIKKLQYQEVATACGLFFDATQEGTLRHLGQPNLNVSLASGRKRNLGDAWAWSRAHAGADITPLVSATNAFYGVGSSKVRKTKSSTTTTRRRARIL